MKPVLLALCRQPANMEAVQRELHKRYAADYSVVCEQETAPALRRLETWQADATPVVVVMAGVYGGGLEDMAFLEQAHALHPHAARVLLTPWQNRSANKPLLRAVTEGRIDRFVPVPAASPDEHFHSLMTELLHRWQRAHHAQREIATLIGERWQARSYEVRDLLERSGLPFAFHESDLPAGQAILQRAGCQQGPFPVLVRFDGVALTNPNNEEAAGLLGARAANTEGLFDLAVVGAGPAGLSAAVYGASEGLRTLVIDRETIGGQAGASSLIRNYMGFPYGISGADLCNRALDQAWSFGAETTVLRDVVDLRADRHERVLRLADGAEIRSRAIVLAMGAAYQRLGIPAVDGLVGAGVFYGGGVTEAQAMSGRHVFVAGAGNSAGQAAVHLAKHARQVTILARGSSLAASMSDYLVQEIEDAPNMDVRLHTTIVGGAGAQHLEALALRDSQTGVTETVPATALFVLIGARPRTEWLPATIRRDGRGFILTGAQAAEGYDELAHGRAPLLLETSMPGLFAAGDVRAGSVKRVAAAVGEGGMAVQLVHQYLTRPVRL